MHGMSIKHHIYFSRRPQRYYLCIVLHLLDDAFIRTLQDKFLPESWTYESALAEMKAEIPNDPALAAFSDNHLVFFNIFEHASDSMGIDFPLCEECVRRRTQELVNVLKKLKADKSMLKDILDNMDMDANPTGDVVSEEKSTVIYFNVIKFEGY